MKPTSIGVHIKVRDIYASKKFYDSLGLKAVFAMGTEEYRARLEDGIESVPEAYNGLVYDVNGAKFEIADGHIGIKNQDVFQDVVPTEKVSAMINVESLVPLFSNPLVDLRFPVRQYYWGTVEAAFRDPDGFVVVLIAQATEEELEKVKKHTEIEVIQNG